jgi:hypothetical protein
MITKELHLAGLNAPALSIHANSFHLLSQPGRANSKLKAYPMNGNAQMITPPPIHPATDSNGKS